MSDTFRRGTPEVDPSARRCLGCGKTMVSRRRHRQLMQGQFPARSRANGRFVFDDSRLIVAHGSHGYCRSCVEHHHPPNRTAKPKKHKQRQSEIWREEWDFLKEGGVSVAEAAGRLGISEDTIRDYDRSKSA